MSLRNWDNKTWLSSQTYINTFIKFIIKYKNINTSSKILDIGCGRGKILGALNSKFKFKNKPLGIDIINHKDKDKRFKFKKTNALIFSKQNKEKFDLILIKQTIHFLKINEINRLLKNLKKNLKPNGKIFIFTLDTYKNEIPTFGLMKKKLNKSIMRDKKILNNISVLYPFLSKKKFIYKVRISKKKYLNMIKDKYISILLPLSKNQILTGINEINQKYKNNIYFKDKLLCLIV
tara:strand:+ start:478 stop:1179 length:702 start_codon:yes stop_codon:yes gene_type:complete